MAAFDVNIAIKALSPAIASSFFTAERAYHSEALRDALSNREWWRHIRRHLVRRRRVGLGKSTGATPGRRVMRGSPT